MGIGLKEELARKPKHLWIMSGYNASTREVIQELMRPKPIRTLVSKHETRVKELMETFQHEPQKG